MFEVESERSQTMLELLKSGMSYEVFVAAYNEQGDRSTGVSDAVAFQTSPDAVDNLKVTEVTDTLVELSWDNVYGGLLCFVW